MHNTMLQESTSLLKELNSLNRKAAASRYQPKTTKLKSPTQASHSQNPQQSQTSHKKNPSSQTTNSSSTLFNPPSQALTILQDKINQMNTKLYEATKTSYFNTSEVDISTPKTKLNSSPIKNRNNDEKQPIKASNLVTRQSIKTHQRERSSDLTQSIERKVSASTRPSPFEDITSKPKPEHYHDQYGTMGQNDEDALLKKTLSYPTGGSINELNSSIKGYFVPPRKYQPQPQQRNTASSVDKKPKLDSVNLNLSHRINMKSTLKPGQSSSRNQSPEVKLGSFESKMTDVITKHDLLKLKNSKKEMKIDIPMDTNESSTNISARRTHNEKTRDTTPSKYTTSATPQNKQPSLKDKTLTDKKNETKDAAASKSWVLTDEEKSTYGDRCPKDYVKLDFLGRGGFALVWLGQCKLTGKKVALKQMLKSNINDSQKKEQYYGQLLFDAGGSPREELKNYPGINSICSFIDLKSTKTDYWHIFELGGPTLSKHLFEIKGEFYKGERIYNVEVKHLDLYKMFKQDQYSFKSFIRQMAEVLQLLSDYNIVHCDLKPDNVLIDLKTTPDGNPFSLKLIDFGSAYNFDDSGNIGMATPEYMPPEFLQKLISTKGNKSAIEQLAEGGATWSIDVWSLGAIIMEILTGVPLWMSLKCKVEMNGRIITKSGMFAVKGRAYDKILVKQKSLIEKFREFAAEFMGDWDDNENLYDLLYNMLRWDPAKRISPSEILEHPYLSQ